MGNKWCYYKWRFKCWLMRVFVCFWKGHKVRWGDEISREPDWCDRRFIDNPDQERTLPYMWENFIDNLPEWLYNIFVK